MCQLRVSLTIQRLAPIVPRQALWGLGCFLVLLPRQYTFDEILLPLLYPTPVTTRISQGVVAAAGFAKPTAP